MNACEDLCMGVQILLATHCASSGTIQLLGTIEVAEPLVNSTCTRSAKPLGGHMSGRNGTETRRSGRVTLRVPLKIFEPNTNKRFLVEEAYSLKVSLWGGLIALRAPVNRHQKLLLVNQATGETAESQIVYLGPMHLGGRRLRLVAIEFLKPSPGFWSIGFPSAVPCRVRAANHSN